MSQNLLNLPPLPGRAGERFRWGELPGAAEGLALAEISARHGGLTLAVVDHQHRLDRLKQELDFFGGADREDAPVLEFPDRQTLPYDRLSPSAELRSERLHLLHALPALKTGVVLVSVSALMHRLPPRDWLFGRSLQVQTGQRMEAGTISAHLENGGYRRVDTVSEHGEYAVRGALLDIFPSGLEMPLRIEFWDDEIESLRFFDAETQRTVERIEECKLLPAREYPLDREGVICFKKRWGEFLRADARRCPVHRQISANIPADGAEYYLPLFFDGVEDLFSYLPEGTLILSAGSVPETAAAFDRQAQERYRNRGADLAHPALRSADLFLDAGDLRERMEGFPQIILQEERVAGRARGAHNFGAEKSETWSPQALAQGASPAQSAKAGRSLFCVSSAALRNALKSASVERGEELRECADWPEFCASSLAAALSPAPLERGLRLRSPLISVFAAETPPTSEEVMQPRQSAAGRAPEAPVRRPDHAQISELGKLQDGAAVVHEEHGVGRYRGFVRLTTAGVEEEFLSLEYAEDARVYVPVDALHLVHPYIGGDPPLHPLNKKKWRQQRRRAERRARDVAAELLTLQAQRALASGVRCPIPETEYAEFVAGFGFVETPDQASAIARVLEDMQSGQPMDRLICGEVGCGKTEIAMRAAFLAVCNGMQVVALTPTTLLCEQHLDTFRRRFADAAVRIEGLSRLNAAAHARAVREDARAGKVDILITTHRLLHREMPCPNPGLLILDEEHRFGVRDKEKLKELRAGMHVLSLSATPIPRTLNMALGGLRDISIIASAPEGRLPVKSFVAPWGRELVREALQRELQRDGQAYYLHNHVATIGQSLERVRAICPEARVACTHGRMKRAELEKIMQRFRRREFDILVCTTIIESGLDIPNANTIVIEDAENFGLAQLHQLRGRVGRGRRQAYAYLLAPERRTAGGKKALQRMEAVAATAEYGAGFQLAVHDLEIRGGGEILGREQSGHLHNLGVSMYSRLLQRATRELRGEKAPPSEQPVSMELRVPALLPETYIPDVGVRLALYRRLGSAASDAELAALRRECRDRFGALPPATENLFRRAALQLQAQTLGIEKIAFHHRSAVFSFAEQAAVPAQRIARLLQAADGRWQFQAPQSLRCTGETAPEQRLPFVEKTLHWLGGAEGEPP